MWKMQLNYLGKKMPLILVLLLSIFSITVKALPVFTASSEVERLISRGIDAAGGEDALMQMQSISRYGSITLYKGGIPERYNYHTALIYFKKLHEEIKGRNIVVDRGTDGNVFWFWTGSQYDYVNEEWLKDYMLETIERANRDLLWLEKEYVHLQITTEQPDWVPINNQCIKGTKRKESEMRLYCFDSKTGLLSALGSNEEYRLVDDWRSVGNIKLPFRLQHYREGKLSYTIQLNRAELNQTMDDNEFNFPVSN
ncbi:hypothetical protein DIZ81_10745 [Legionella taurinensis]|uniref:Outer membrane lipoprotein-sorting protein n=2 Tax=Legionella taurinensis TaxID=70611 RepID=A0A3A5LTY6_9GAMM|nr:hypothetical protein [Legionella taurinensis]MDX1838325.1 hypothetical protein [Legionella taurinensis]PUT39090.1 hypothetical protein DB744_10755 [Legionella taurinensis]PUT39544.1 hypothetical protein DB746_13410 [Legionella taurinensis]PUT43546.1 hypothetical protein DB743_10145 [Legionella taurinensis]PUT45200.1 hypothetical protein DB745_13350 [Legionella taurinensis]